MGRRVSQHQVPLEKHSGEKHNRADTQSRTHTHTGHKTSAHTEYNIHIIHTTYTHRKCTVEKDTIQLTHRVKHTHWGEVCHNIKLRARREAVQSV